MVALAVRFLSAFEAAEHGAPSRPEWPPHPDRLFQALVATANEAELGAGAMDALRALELEAPPEITCSRAAPVCAHKVFVPSNFDAAQISAGRYFPQTVPDETTVYYTWPGAPVGICSTLSLIAGELTHLGRVTSLVSAAVVNDAPESMWLPDPQGELLLRVPHAGRLDALDEAFRRGRWAPPPPMAGYRKRRREEPSGPWGDLVVVRVTRPWPMRRVVEMAEALRAAVMSVFGDDAPEWLHGHQSAGGALQRHHAAWLGLPDVGHRHARGHLLGLGICLPSGLSAAERARLAFALAGIATISVGGANVDIAVSDGMQAGLSRTTWARPSRLWASVTPVALDRFPKPNKGLTEEIIVADSIEGEGYPRPLRVSVVPRSQFRGASGSTDFRTRRSARLLRHVVLEFDSPVAGPMLVGAERYFGLGLLRPLNARTPSYA